MFILSNNILITNNHITCNINLRSQFQQTLTYAHYTFLDPSATLRNATIGFVMCVHPHGTILLPLDAFSLSLMFGNFFETISRKFKFY